MYQKNDLVLYNNSIKSKVLDVHHDGDEPYYTIQLPDREKQTDGSHLSIYTKSLFNRNYFRKNKLRPSILFKNYSKRPEPYCNNLYTPPTSISKSNSDSDLETIDLDSISECSSSRDSYSL